ncbi:MAG: polysaccharide pyruvyl transferase family protein, partial [Myxococcales bacterium]|nr:polysaccharide pyruvyl transferase family protein [Myxococcales bacterium]
DRAFDAVVAVARELARRGHRLLHVPLHRVDAALGARLAAAVGPALEVAPRRADVGAVVADIARCEVFVGQRLHATVLAAASGVPPLSLAYQPKCLDFLESIDAADLAVPTESVDGGGLLERVEGLLAAATAVRERVVAAVAAHRRRQERRGAELVAWARDPAAGWPAL